MGQIKWLGHAGFEIVAEKKIFIDPFKIDGSVTDKADIILITHSHYDHLSIEDIKKLSTKDTTILITPDGQSNLRNYPGKVILVEPNKGYKVEGLKVMTVPMYNTNKHFHPKQNEWVGYIIESEGKKIYHSGDCDFMPEMKEFSKYNIDVAMLPVGGTYTMTASEAANAAIAIKPKLAIPMHFGNVVGTDKDAQMFKQLLDGKITVQLPQK